MPIEEPIAAATRRAGIAAAVRRFRAGEITAPVLELLLASLIPAPELAVHIRQIEELRAAPVPGITPLPQEHPAMAAVRQETVRAHIDMFRHRLIPLQELYTYLLADGLPEAVARATALTQALKRTETPPLDPDVVTYLEDVQEVRRFAGPESVSY